MKNNINQEHRFNPNVGCTSCKHCCDAQKEELGFDPQNITWRFFFTPFFYPLHMFLVIFVTVCAGLGLAEAMCWIFKIKP